MFDPTGYNATNDSESGAGYGSSNGAHDPTGVGGISNGYPEGQYGGNSQKTYSESISLSLKKSADDFAANQQNQFAQPGVDLALARIRFFGPFGWVDAMCDDCAPIWGPVRPQDPTEPRETNQTGLKLPTVSMPGVLGFIQRGLSALNVVQSEGADKPSLLDPKGEDHVLDGDATGGGHAPGTGKPGKSEFPSGWSRDKITGEISDVATDPNSTTSPGRNGRTVVNGTRDGINIEVILEPNGRIVTGYPTNIPRNPRR